MHRLDQDQFAPDKLGGEVWRREGTVHDPWSTTSFVMHGADSIVMWP